MRACQHAVPATSGAALRWRAPFSRTVSRVCSSCSFTIASRCDRWSPRFEVARSVGASVALVRDSGHHVHAGLQLSGGATLELDVVHESLVDLERGPTVDGVVVESLADLRAAKLTCLRSRTEPRDLVDVLFLERAGFAPENDLALAARKDAGMDPGVLAWLLRSFRISPLPIMLEPLTAEELREYRDGLAQRFRRMAGGG